MKSTLLSLTLTLLIPLALIGCARSGETAMDDDITMADDMVVPTPVEAGSEEAMELLGATTSESNTIVENAAAIPNLSNLVEAVQAAGLAETLNGPGPFTVFAPINQAFETAGMTEFGMMSENEVENLQQLLSSHVADGDLEYGELTEGLTVVMLSEEEFPILQQEDEFLSKRIGDADFVVYNVESSNGVIHLINLVLNPEDR
jgi:uncharacterized surface protein with fasciclin (FAS1) repeats